MKNLKTTLINFIMNFVSLIEPQNKVEDKTNVFIQSRFTWFEYTQTIEPSYLLRRILLVKLNFIRIGVNFKILSAQKTRSTCVLLSVTYQHLKNSIINVQCLS